jgi:hypothetical protein
MRETSPETTRSRREVLKRYGACKRGATTLLWISLLLSPAFTLPAAKLLPGCSSESDTATETRTAAEAGGGGESTSDGTERAGSESVSPSGSSYFLPRAVTIPAPQGAPAVISEFRPFGWSEDGRFAFLSVTPMEGRGGVVFRYTILDAVSDEEVFSLVDDSFEWEGWSEANREATPEESWRRFGPAVSEELSRSGIAQSGGLAVESFPLERNGMSYRSGVLVEIDTRAEDPAFDRLSAYEIWIRRVGRDAKRLSRQEDVFAIDAHIPGYIASPHEERVLVAVLEERYVFEGTVLVLRLFGSSLESGFTPRSVLPDGTVTGSYGHEHGVAELSFVERPDGTLDVEGYAEWIGQVEGQVHVGEVSGTALYGDGAAVYEDEWGCHLDFVFDSGKVTVSEHGTCGGLNVTFSGDYLHVRR